MEPDMMCGGAGMPFDIFLLEGAEMQARWLCPKEYDEAAELCDISLTEIEFLLGLPYSSAFALWDGEFMQAVCLYQYEDGAIKVHRLDVHSDVRRRGYGRKLLSYLCSFMRQCSLIERVEVVVPEEDLSSQIFLRSCRFVARPIGADQYFFEFRKTSLAGSGVREV